MNETVAEGWWTRNRHGVIHGGRVPNLGIGAVSAKANGVSEGRSVSSRIAAMAKFVLVLNSGSSSLK